jgi:hypothetical protein
LRFDYVALFTISEAKTVEVCPHQWGGMGGELRSVTTAIDIDNPSKIYTQRAALKLDAAVPLGSCR